MVFKFRTSSRWSQFILFPILLPDKRRFLETDYVWSRMIPALARVRTNTNWKQEANSPCWKWEKKLLPLLSLFFQNFFLCLSQMYVKLYILFFFLEVSPLRNVFSGTWEPPFWSTHIKGDRAPLSRFPWEHRSLTSWHLASICKTTSCLKYMRVLFLLGNKANAGGAPITMRKWGWKRCCKVASLEDQWLFLLRTGLSQVVSAWLPKGVKLLSVFANSQRVDRDAHHSLV